MRGLYTTGIRLYVLLISIASLWNSKARQWTNGRKKWQQQLTKALPVRRDRKICWIHCSSLGEFEQSRPIIEALTNRFPDVFILLTFFSPSGYEIRKSYPQADLIMYLPADTPQNAHYFVQAVAPDVAIFIKYEFWLNYINALSKQQIPLYSVSAIFRKNQVFFKSWGKWYRKHLGLFSHFFVQNRQSADLLKAWNITNVTISGDTRYDRVYAIAAQNKPVEAARALAAHNFTLVAGSTWPPEHNLLIRLANEKISGLRIIIAPHELHEKTFRHLENSINGKVVRYSQTTTAQAADAKVLIIDNIGLLSTLYRYGQAALVGGGFGKGIHNTLEAAVYGIPVMFGPNHQKFHEARTMIEHQIAFSINNYETFYKLLTQFMENKDYYNELSRRITEFINKQLGATEIVLQSIDKELLS